jgi:uncharacterized YigZ family protein
MSKQMFYYTIERNSTAEFKDRGSRFIALAFPIQSVDDFKLQYQQVKKDHAKAVHHCFGYRIGNEGNIYRVSDDGEPSGTAGKPILGQLASKQIVNAAVVVVRYFGGTLLGVPGLINAYKTTASLALQLTPLVQKQVMLVYKLSFDYTRMNDVMMIIKQFGCEIRSSETMLFCEMLVSIPKARIDEVLFKLNELRAVEMTIVS